MSSRVRGKPDAEKWEKRELGASAEHAVPTTLEEEQAIDEALGLQPVSIRLPKSLVEDLKALGKEKNLGYQPYLRMILTDHVKAVRSAKRR